MASEHIVKSYDDELKHLKALLSRMGGLVEAQIADAMDAVGRRDSELARRTVDNDAKIDTLEREVDASVVRMLALRQPMAVDLRSILAALKISSDLERIGDYATNAAKRAIALNQMPAARPAGSVPRMGRLVQSIVKDVLDAYVDGDADKAVAVWRRDEEVDELYNSLFRELLTYMMEDPRNITPCTHLLFMAKNIERMGDHATNVAETVYFQVRGQPLKAERPKGDSTSFTVINPDAKSGQDSKSGQGV
ncbi:MAG: phosphate signaling complex protein PhoU [Alphaproteobacteria bacterium]|nr:phosphate signaling complex protein PhoU [Alphaproteobacteria bacterium]